MKTKTLPTIFRSGASPIFENQKLNLSRVDLVVFQKLFSFLLICSLVLIQDRRTKPIIFYFECFQNLRSFSINFRSGSYSVSGTIWSILFSSPQLLKNKNLHKEGNVWDVSCIDLTTYSYLLHFYLLTIFLLIIK